MAMVMDLEFSNFSYSTTTTASTDDGGNWDAWSPLVDWEALSGGHEDFQNLLDAVMDDRTIGPPDQEYRTTYNSLSPESNTTIPDEDFKGLRLVHLLTAAAEALSGADKCWELARVILVRLKELVSPNDGTTMERLAAYFADALQGLLDGHSGAGAGTGPRQSLGGSRYHAKEEHHQQSDVLAAFQLLQDMSPYVKFGHFTANQAILEAVMHDRRVHIVDYDITEGIQWASLMQSLVSRKDGPPPPHLRITALSRGGSGRRSLGTVQETGRRLTAFAASIGLPFSFHQCRLDSADETFKSSSLKLVKGEALVVNCMLHLPHFSYRAPDSISSFLSGSKALNPRLITLVEEEMDPIAKGGFVDRFMDLLHHYSAVYDSLEAGFPMQCRARALVERVFLGPRIAASLGRVYWTRDREEEEWSWGQWLGSIGFRPVSTSFANNCQSKLLLGLYNDGYRVEELDCNKLVLGWKARRLLSASIWTTQDVDL